ncbi:MAG: AAA family ATPase [Muribaculaceae bacterium]|nr:AAA family ATPase [Muribaculaceae bacterium]
MKLTRYKVLNYKSVKDSGWIDCSEVTTLVGINEAGKSNLLLALWKLNPVTGGEIDVLHDAPVSELNDIREIEDNYPFIKAEFELDETDNERIKKSLGQNITEINKILVTRYYSGRYEIEYPEKQPNLIIDDLSSEISEEDSQKENEENLALDFEVLEETLIKEMPKFVYYSNYGNLSTRLYLPNVITWLKGGNITGIDRNEDQIRTMRVLFKFVKLNPEEILELGMDPKDMAAKRSNNRNTSPTTEEINKAQKQKEMRTILLQSAESKLTEDFRNWWKQGDYKFRFIADGDYLSIRVSDNKRPAEVGLEQRSTGLQWFISFFLVFLVESKEEHKNAILLLDEAGLTLHPNAQKDLSLFFNELSKENQIINTTHSPFIVDTNHIDRCKVVYVDNYGYTVASSNLRESSDKLNEQSIYAVHAALGLSVSDILFQGCKPIIVEGVSDQIYLNAMKQLLISIKKFSPKEEIIFVPSGGVKGISPISSLLGGKKGSLPKVIVDSDKSGKDFIEKLTKSLYKENKDLILEIGKFKEITNAEIEDLIPYEYLETGINIILGYNEEIEFKDYYNSKEAIIPQIEKFAEEYNVDLKEGWKVDLAKSVKSRMLRTKEYPIDVEIWEKLFNKLID